MILIMIVLVFENNMQTYVPVANIDITLVCLDPFASGEEDYAGMFTQVFVAILDELYPGGLRIIIEGKIDFMDKTHGFLAISYQLACTTGKSQYCYEQNNE